MSPVSLILTLNVENAENAVWVVFRLAGNMTSNVQGGPQSSSDGVSCLSLSSD